MFSNTDPSLFLNYFHWQLCIPTWFIRPWIFFWYAIKLSQPKLVCQSFFSSLYVVCLPWAHLNTWGKKYLDALPCYPTSLTPCPCRTIWTLSRACLTFSHTKLAESLIHSPLFLTVQQARTCCERPWRALCLCEMRVKVNQWAEYFCVK